MRVTTSDPKTPRFFKAVHEVCEQEACFVVSFDEVMLGSFEQVSLLRCNDAPLHCEN